MDMQVERKEWQFFADSFSEENYGRPITIESITQARGDEFLAEKMPLLALDFDIKGVGAAMITVGEGTETFIHTLNAPEAVWFERLASGKMVAMEIVVTGGDKLIIKFDDM